MDTVLLKRPSVAWCLTAGYAFFCFGVILMANFAATYPLFVAAVRQVPGGDKTAHVLMLGLLALLLNTALNGATVRVLGFTLLKGNLFLVWLATLEEMSNMIQPGRTYSALDLQCNILGIFAFGWICWLFTRREDD